MMYDTESALRHIKANRARVSGFVEHYGGFGNPPIPTVTLVYPNGSLGYLHFWSTSDAQTVVVQWGAKEPEQYR